MVQTAVMRPSSLFSSIAAGFFLLAQLSTGLFAQAEPPSGESRPPALSSEASVGFYKGIILLSGSGGSLFDVSGDLARSEKSQVGDRRLQALGGASDLRLLGGAAISPLFLLSSQFSAEQGGSGVLEYGLSDQFSAGLAFSSSTIDVTRQRRLPLPTPGLLTTGDLRFYTEAAPLTERFYRDSVWMAHFAFHPVEKTQVDPYIFVRAGVLTFHTSYQSSDAIPNLFGPSEQSGRGYALGAGAGANLFLTPEFGIKVEASWLRRLLRGDQGLGSALNTTHIEAGFFLNFHNISRYSY